MVDLPCSYRTRSRWLKVDITESDCFSADLDPSTEQEFQKALSSSADDNPHMKDIYFRGTCAEGDRSKHDMKIYIESEGQCYQNVHPDTLSVYDVSLWATDGDDSTILHHPGGPAAIRKWTSSGVLVFPDWGWHKMERWQMFSKMEDRFGKLIGRKGDSIKFDELPIELQTESLANTLGANKLENVIGNSNGVLVCGSQDEVEPDPLKDDYFDLGLYDQDTLDAMYRPRAQRHTIWTHHALYANDQLRQRMAWALSQVGISLICILYVFAFSYLSFIRFLLSVQTS